MRTLRNNISSVENCFLATCSVSSGSGKARRNKIKCFAIAIIKSFVLIRNNINRLICIRNRARRKCNPQIALHIFRINVTTKPISTSNLHINKLVAVIDLFNKLSEQFVKLVTLYRNVHTEKFCGIVKSCKVRIHIKNNMIMSICCIINTITKPTNSVKHRNLHFFNLVILTVIIA